MIAGNPPSLSPSRVLPIAAAAVVGGWLVIRAQWWEWSVNPQYSYGFFVPILALGLLWTQWQDRPAPGDVRPRGRAASMVCIICSTILLALVQPVFETNQDWRAVPAASVAAASGILFSLVYLLGGLPWLRHFWFSIAFLWLGVPWPSQFEARIMGVLMSGNAGLCVEALHWMGYEAVRQGHLIALPTGLLGVEEACSGIRSLQSGLTASLLVGEFLRLGLWRRVFLVVMAVVAALLGNAGRTIFLSLAASSSGPDAVEHWHDIAGNAVLLGTIAILCLIGLLLEPKCRERPAYTPPPFHVSRLAAWATPALVILGVWLTTLGATALWYGSAAPPPDQQVWHIGPAPDSDGVTADEISPRTRMILLNPDIAVSEEWRDDEGRNWHLFYFRWKPGRTAIRSAMSVHLPTGCLTAVGLTLQEEYPFSPMTTMGFEVPFKRYRFLHGKDPVYVFHAVEADGGGGTDKEFSGAGRLRSVFARERNSGLRVLEFAVSGAKSLEDAEKGLREILSRRLVATE